MDRHRYCSWIALVAVALAVVCGADVEAQDRLLVVGGTSPTAAPVLEVAADGTRITTIATLPRQFVPHVIQMGDDNQSYRVFGRDTRLGAQYVLDLNGGVFTTLVSGSPLFMGFGGVRDSRGDWYVLNRASLGGMSILQLSGSTLSPLSSVMTLNPTALTLDRETGDLIVRAITTANGSGYFHVDPHAGVVTSLVTTTSITLASGHAELVYDPSDGGVIDAQRINFAAQVLRIAPEAGAVPFGPSHAGFVPHGMTRSGPRRFPVAYYLLASQNNGTASIFQYLEDGIVASTASLGTQVIASAFTRVGGRHLAWFTRQAPNDRQLRLSFPSEVGKPYVVAFSLRGMRPGLRIPGRRTIPIAFDPLVVASVTGALPGLLVNSVGSLNARGEAVVDVNLNQLGNAVRGVKMWAAAIVLDPASPTGIASIVGPTLLELDGVS